MQNWPFAAALLQRSRVGLVVPMGSQGQLVTSVHISMATAGNETTICDEPIELQPVVFPDVDEKFGNFIFFEPLFV